MSFEKWRWQHPYTKTYGDEPFPESFAEVALAQRAMRSRLFFLGWDKRPDSFEW